LEIIDVRGPNDFEAAFKAARRGEALVHLDDVLFASHRTLLVELALGNRLPAIYGFRGWVEAGGLMPYGPNYAEVYRRAATFVVKILKGAKPANLAVEQPTKFELVINVKTAKALGSYNPAVTTASSRACHRLTESSPLTSGCSGRRTRSNFPHTSGHNQRALGCP
jgi:putative ABC transport system substrate-binding protein